MKIFLFLAVAFSLVLTGPSAEAGKEWKAGAKSGEKGKKQKLFVKSMECPKEYTISNITAKGKYKHNTPGGWVKFKFRAIVNNVHCSSVSVFNNNSCQVRCGAQGSVATSEARINNTVFRNCEVVTRSDRTSFFRCTVDEESVSIPGCGRHAVRLDGNFNQSDWTRQRGEDLSHLFAQNYEVTDNKLRCEIFLSGSNHSRFANVIELRPKNTWCEGEVRFSRKDQKFSCYK